MNAASPSTTGTASTPSHSENATRVIPVRRPGRILAAAVVLIVVVLVAQSLVTNPNFQWDVVGRYFFTPNVLMGLYRTLELTVIAMVAGLALGVVLAVMKLSPNPLIKGVSSAYIWFFRGTPLLVQIVFWYNLSALFPSLTIGVPFGGPTWVTLDTNAIITPYLAAILALGLNEAAYLAEIVRGGLLAVDTGQTEAAQALGMNRMKVLRRIVLPQAMRVIVPPVGNETISMLKLTSLVSVVSLPELLYSVQSIYQSTYQVIPLLLVASIWYLIVTTILSIGQYFVEGYYGRGFGRGRAPRRGRVRRSPVSGSAAPRAEPAKEDVA